MKIITWNVNGFRAVLKKGFEEFFNSETADMVCLQETKMQPGQADFEPEGYDSVFCSAEKKGYSGTAIFYKNELKDRIVGITTGLNGKHEDEGRVITIEYDNFYMVNCYVPNAQDGLKRIDYRMEFEDDMRAYLSELDKNKPVIYCGDLNVAHTEIDLKNPKTNKGNAGFSDEERGKFTELLEAGFADVWRRKNPDVEGVYSWWSYRFKAREKNAGWRIDYFVISERLMDKVTDIKILTDVFGSDHCPVRIEIEV